MARDPMAVGHARVSGQTLAEILNGFVEPLSVKSMVRLCVCVCVCVCALVHLCVFCVLVVELFRATGAHMQCRSLLER